MLSSVCVKIKKKSYAIQFTICQINTSVHSHSDGIYFMFIFTRAHGYGAKWRQQNECARLTARAWKTEREMYAIKISDRRKKNRIHFEVTNLIFWSGRKMPIVRAAMAIFWYKNIVFVVSLYTLMTVGQFSFLVIVVAAFVNKNMRSTIWSSRAPRKIPSYQIA